MSKKSMPEMPNSQEWIMYFQQDPDLADQAFAILYERFHPYILKRRPVSITEDDWEDIASEVWMRVWKSLGSFEYRGEPQLKGWFRTVLRSVVSTYWGKKNRLQQLSLDYEIASSDGSTTTLGESLLCACELFEDQEDWEQRECVKMAVRQCLSNEEQVRLFEARMDNVPDGLERPDNWKHQYWFRGKKKVIETCQENTPDSLKE